MKILADKSLPGLKKAFPPPFELSTYHDEISLKEGLPGQELLLCRATLKVNQALLASHPLNFVATASSGTDHLDLALLKARKIQVLDAKGANAQAVALYVEACLRVLKRKKVLLGKQAAVIGMGPVGQAVAESLQKQGYQVISYDPPKALRDPSYHSASIQAVYDSDLICLHANLHDEPPYASRNLINASFLQNLKETAVLINAARGALLDEAAFIHNKKKLIYCTDVYLHEPNINPALIDKAFLCTPHIAGHTMEAKYRAIDQISAAVHKQLGLSYQEQLAQTLKCDSTAETPYDPEEESLIMKESKDLAKTFQKLRQKHLRYEGYSIEERRKALASSLESVP